MLLFGHILGYNGVKQPQNALLAELSRAKRAAEHHG